MSGSARRAAGVYLPFPLGCIGRTAGELEGERVHRITWEFLPAPGREAEFRSSYGPQGPWVELFSRAPGYLGTELLPTPERPGWYRTVDFWVSAEAHANFLSRFGEAYQELDRACAALTAEEQKVGAE